GIWIAIDGDLDPRLMGAPIDIDAGIVLRPPGYPQCGGVGGEGTVGCQLQLRPILEGNGQKLAADRVIVVVTARLNVDGVAVRSQIDGPLDVRFLPGHIDIVGYVGDQPAATG